MSRAATSDQINEIRITDPYVANLVAEEQKRTGERSMARTASRLITERLAIREAKPEPTPEPDASSA
jgi:hypothetical protein